MPASSSPRAQLLQCMRVPPEIIDSAYGDSDLLFWSGHGSHVGSVGHKSTGLGHTLDGRVCAARPVSYYMKNGLVGSFINDCYTTGKSANVEEIEIEGVEFRHPYSAD
eukprot:2302652-Rhodomonas_salina.1